MSDIPITTLTCPKCGGTMASYERNGVIVDQCQECRGVFLDRGELERLIDAEEQRYGLAPPATRGPDPYDDRRAEQYDDRKSGGHHSDRGSGHGGKRKRSGFLGELFD